MEFFAFIGLITVAWIIYDLTKYIFIDCPKQEEEEARIIAEETKEAMIPGEFVFDRSDDQLHEKVFEPIEYEQKHVVVPINRSLEKASAYVRLYYHILQVYEGFIEEEPEVRAAVYRIEMLRREIQNRLIYADIDTNDDFRLELHGASNTILLYSGPIINAYERVREVCLSKEVESKVERLNLIYSVLDAEKILFHDFPETNSYYAKTGDAYLDKVFSTDETTAKVAQAVREGKPLSTDE